MLYQDLLDSRKYNKMTLFQLHCFSLVAKCSSFEFDSWNGSLINLFPNITANGKDLTADMYSSFISQNSTLWKSICVKLNNRLMIYYKAGIGGNNLLWMLCNVEKRQITYWYIYMSLSKCEYILYQLFIKIKFFLRNTFTNVSIGFL